LVSGIYLIRMGWCWGEVWLIDGRRDELEGVRIGMILGTRETM
jgi:hypothetical protein